MSNEYEQSAVEANFNAIQADLNDMKQSMSKMADALAKIAILEERHSVMASQMLRVSEKLEKLDSRQNDLELRHVKQDTAIKVTIRAIQVIWSIIGAGVLIGAWQVVKLVAGH